MSYLELFRTFKRSKAQAESEAQQLLADPDALALLRDFKRKRDAAEEAARKKRADEAINEEKLLAEIAGVNWSTDGFTNPSEGKTPATGMKIRMRPDLAGCEDKGWVDADRAPLLSRHLEGQSQAIMIGEYFYSKIDAFIIRWHRVHQARG